MDSAIARCQPGPIQMLLVEDNPGDAILFQKCLAGSERRADVEVIYDGEEALERLKRLGGYRGKALPDLIVMDLNLPRVSGLELLEELKASPSLRVIPVLVLTSSEDVEDVRRCYQAGANCVLIKASDYEGVSRLVRLIEEFWVNTVCFSRAPRNTE